MATINTGKDFIDLLRARVPNFHFDEDSYFALKDQPARGTTIVIIAKNRDGQQIKLSCPMDAPPPDELICKLQLFIG